MSFSFSFSYVIALLSAFALSVLALPGAPTQYNVTYDNFYDNPNTSLSQVSCSNGANGLLTKGYTTFSSLPSFPNIGGVPYAQWNSVLCGTCWHLEYVTLAGNYESIYITAVDASYTINLSQEGFNTLTDNTGIPSGKVTAAGTQVDASFCGM